MSARSPGLTPQLWHSSSENVNNMLNYNNLGNNSARKRTYNQSQTKNFKRSFIH